MITAYLARSVPNSDSPCEMFEKIAFPTVEFFPRGLEEPHCKEENDTEGQGEAQG